MACGGIGSSLGMRNIIKTSRLYRGNSLPFFRLLLLASFTPGILESYVRRPLRETRTSPRAWVLLTRPTRQRTHLLEKFWEVPIRQASGPASVSFICRFREKL